MSYLALEFAPNGREVDAEFTPLHGDVTELPEGLYWGKKKQPTHLPL